MTKAVRTKLIGMITKATKEWTKLYTPPKEEKVSAKAQKIYDALNKTDFGCRRKDVQTIIEALSGEKLPAHPTTKRDLPMPPRFCAIVPEKIYDGHDYPAGDVSISNGSWYGMMRPNGKMGNDLSNGKHVRPATPAEIKKIPSEQLEALVRDFGLVIL